ncbi:MAG: TolC family protein [Firmicutes bacterium]|nr:TolC family protein [Bacillota bacterium]
MKTEGSKLSLIILVLVLSWNWPLEGATREINSLGLGLEQALELAFSRSPRYSLFLREWEIREKQAQAAKGPAFKVSVTPMEIENGAWEKPRGRINLSLPLGSAVDLGASLSFKFDQRKLEAVPEGSINLDYSFFAQEKEPQSPAERGLLDQKNALVLEVTDLLIELKSKLNLEEYLQKRYEFLQKSLWAAGLTPNYSDLSLKAEIRGAVQDLAHLRGEIDLLQVKLDSQLQTGTTAYQPSITVRDPEFVLDFAAYQKELFAFNPNLRLAREKLKAAEAELTQVKKTRGWDLKARGQINLDTTWSIGLTAKKEFSSPGVRLQELELELAQAELALEEQELSLKNQLREALQRVDSALTNIELQAEHLAEAQEDLAYTQRQFQVGLAAELTLKEGELAVQKARFEYANAQFNYVQSVLRLYGQCGRDLRQEVKKLMK